MLKRIQNWLVNVQKKQAQKLQLRKLQRYYKEVRNGMWFLKFIQQDLEKMKKNSANRHIRRRFEKSLNSLELTEEMVQYYQGQIDNILNYINLQLNPPKTGTMKINKEAMQKGIEKTKETK